MRHTACLLTALVSLLPALQAEDKKPSKSKAFDVVEPTKEPEKAPAKKAVPKRVEAEPTAPTRNPLSFKGGYMKGSFTGLKVLRSGDVEVSVDVYSTNDPGFVGTIALAQSSTGYTTWSLSDHWAAARAKLTTSGGDELQVVDASGISFDNSHLNTARLTKIEVDSATPVTFKFRPPRGVKISPSDTFTLDATITNIVFERAFSIPHSTYSVPVRLQGLKAK